MSSRPVQKTFEGIALWPRGSLLDGEFIIYDESRVKVEDDQGNEHLTGLEGGRSLGGCRLVEIDENESLPISGRFDTGNCNNFRHLSWWGTGAPPIWDAIYRNGLMHVAWPQPEDDGSIEIFYSVRRIDPD